MNDAITRLRAAKEKQASGFYAAGQALGRRWVEKHAEPIELKRIGEIRDEQRRRGQWESWFESEESVWTPGESLHHMIMGGEEIYGSPDPCESAEFWEFVGATSEERCDSKFVLGFADVAADFWDTIKNEI